MGKNQSASNLTNIIKQDASGNITFVSGSTTLMSVSSSGAITTTGNVAGTASYASNAELLDGLDSTVFTLTSSFAAQTASFTAFTASVNTFTASQNILNGTYATTGSNTFEGIQTINSNLTVTGSITAQTLVVQTVTSSVVYSSGSNVFGNNIANTQTFTGSMSVSGGLVVTTTAPELTVGATGVTLGNVLTDVHNVTGSLGVTGSINATATTHSFFGRVGINTLASNIDALWVSGSIGFSTGGGGGLTFADRSGNDLRIYTPSGATRFVDGTGLSTFLTIQSSNGNVGIGTTSPSGGISGTEVALELSNSNAAVLALTSTAASGKKFQIYSSNDGGLYFRDSTAATIRMAISSSGNIGINTTSPDTFLTIDGQTSTSSTVNLAKIYSSKGQSDGTYLQIGGTRHVTQTVRRMLLDAIDGGGTAATLCLNTAGGGNVGIGTYTPVSKLSVAGVVALGNSIDGTTNLSYGGRISAKMTTVTGGAGATIIHRGLGSVGYFILVSGVGPSGIGRFVDLVYGTGGTATPTTLASSTGGTSAPTRTYSLSAEKLSLSLSGGDAWTVTTTGLGAMEE